jgi:hypothetical protein
MIDLNLDLDLDLNPFLSSQIFTSELERLRSRSR